MAQSRGSGRRLEAALVVELALAASHALGRLHRLGIVHRDIKPGNLHLGDDGVWRILDLGVAVSGSEPKSLRTLHAGTPSYMNPEQWARDRHVAADAGSDLYALGCTLYQALSGALPYGEIEPYQSGRFRRDPKPLSRRRTDVPMWLDHIVLKAVALDPRHRFETAEELTLALERGASRPLAAPGATPLAARDPAALWKIAFAVALLFDAAADLLAAVPAALSRLARPYWAAARPASRRPRRGSPASPAPSRPASRSRRSVRGFTRAIQGPSSLAANAFSPPPSLSSPPPPPRGPGRPFRPRCVSSGSVPGAAWRA